MLEINIKTIDRMIALLENIVNKVDFIENKFYHEDIVIKLSNEVYNWYDEATEILKEIKEKDV